MIIAGVMSGSSLDGIDIAVVQFDDVDHYQILSTALIPYPTHWVEKIANFHTLTAKEYIHFSFEYSYQLATSLKKYIDNQDFAIDYIASHGHTIVHSPDQGYTEQIGNGGILSGVIGIPTLSDFRVADMARKGQGTPLAPTVEHHLFAGYDYYLNLGGIANITVINQGNFLAFDVCPFNQVTNHYSRLEGQAYDKDGIMASKGKKSEALFSYFDSYEYFSIDGPKSLDNSWITDTFISNSLPSSTIDTLHTFILWSAQKIADTISYSDNPTQLFATGGGVHNTYFITVLTQLLQTKNCKLVVPTIQIIDYKEAILMAYLGYRYLRDLPNVMSAATGSIGDTIGGALYKV